MKVPTYNISIAAFFGMMGESLFVTLALSLSFWSDCCCLQQRSRYVRGIYSQIVCLSLRESESDCWFVYLGPSVLSIEQCVERDCITSLL